MNTNKLKKFAQETRKKLLKRVEERLDYVLNTDSPELREQQKQIEALRKELKRTNRDDLIDKVAYTWFNRLVALRYMDVNDYQPFHVRVISPQDGFTEPQILSDAKQGIIPDDFKVDRAKINQLLDGTLDSQNPQNEVFKLLLVAACNNLHSIFPFLFEPIADYSELLLPADLISEHSVIHDVVEGMTAEDCQQVEILGWLYQFYISEKKDEVFASKGKVKKEEIPAATQLFTPRWIVEYMVQNTVGKLWVLNHPNSRLTEHMEYYIESEVTAEDVLTIDKPEELTLLDQACGSGHILVYGFELLYKIYEEEGYVPSDIPRLIIEHNLHGFEIDERAAQLAGLAILMKAREHQRRLFRKSDVPEPNITCFEDLALSDEEIKATLKSAGVKTSDELLNDLQNMQQATNFGSLIVPRASLQEIQQAKTACEQAMDSADLFEKEKLEQLMIALETLEKLGTKMCCVVDNPPYMGYRKMNKLLSEFVKFNFPDANTDLLTCFMERAEIQLHVNGFLSMINLPSWMFLSSFEEFRKWILNNYQIDSLLHLGRGIFGSDFGTVAFSFLKTTTTKSEGIFRRLFDRHVQVRGVEKIRKLYLDSNYGYYKTPQNNFRKIPGNPISYWLGDKEFELFETKVLGDEYSAKVGLQTGDNDRFIRYFHEVNINNFSVFDNGLNKWIPFNKGGNERKWYGNRDFVIKWEDDGRELKDFKPRSVIRNEDYYFKQSISCSGITSSKVTFLYYPGEGAFDINFRSFFPKNDSYYLLGLLNSKIVLRFANALNPTMAFNVGDLKRIPLVGLSNNTVRKSIEPTVESILAWTKQDWDSREISWDFQQNELIRFNKEGGIDTLEDAYEHYRQYWTNKFFQLHENEEELNRQFIEIYDLQEELTPEVPLDEITILQEELDSKKLKKKDSELGRQKSEGRNPDLPFKDKEVFAQFISYAVGCMFGRYSLDKEGLILANQGETLEDYLEKVALSESEVSFLPDEDNIIPVLEDDWFEDDITGLFYQFLRASFGEQNFEKNLAFIEDKLGHDIRTYFSKYFYKDHYKRYNKRPIYWQFSSENGVFKALIYMHRYTPDTLNHMLNGYLRDFKSKLNYQKSHLQDVINAGQDAKEVNKAEKELRKVESMIEELESYERDVLMPLATDRIEIDLDDGVLVNYNKFGQAVEEVKSLNDKKKKKKVKEFDWIDGSEIR
ncbi:BREX-1 system adenine-specific DNA-methyltransferase PglX [Gracilimonas sp.]|uniref:BREX-1 system adenine-specific DNA-methyltransferase PglX n=1 Tax=Gracilimonas sp. TaxID=1974203 RepID=UPI003D09F442